MYSIKLYGVNKISSVSAAAGTRVNRVILISYVNSHLVNALSRSVFTRDSCKRKEVGEVNFGSRCNP